MTRILTALGALLAAAAVAPAPALAHGLPSPPGVPVPGWLFSWVAALVLVGSFLAVSRMWTEPRLEDAPARPIVRMPAALEAACGLIGVALLAFLVFCGFAGAQDPDGNLLPEFVFVAFWVGLVPVSVLLGDVFAAFNPWRAVGRAAARLGRGRRAPLGYPAWLGRWPAAVGIFAFVFLELIAPKSARDPHGVAVAACVYTGVQLTGMALFGPSAWLRQAEAFGEYFGLFGRMGVLCVRDGRLCRRRWLSGLTTLPVVAGTVALLCVMIGSTSFDGLTETTLWDALSITSEAGQAVAMVVMIAIIAAVYRIGVAGMRSVAGPGADAGALARRFVHSIVPIAAAYVFAHYLSFFVTNIQGVWFTANNPLGDGHLWHLFGAGLGQPDQHVLGKALTWYLQVAGLVAGHVAAIVLAHDRALVVFDRPRTATRSQYWMLVAMVFYTSLGLFLLATIKR